MGKFQKQTKSHTGKRGKNIILKTAWTIENAIKELPLKRLSRDLN